MRDSFGRRIDYLRLSVTSGCNLRCIYCRPAGEVSCPSPCRAPSPAEIVEAAAEVGITKVRITGGEPCIRGDLPELVGKIAATSGIEEVCLTTNGTLLAPMAGELRANGLSRVNISIDSLIPERYRAITRGGSLDDALAGLAACKAAGFENTKVNCVLIGGVNDGEVDAFDSFAAEQGVEVRFIELMPLGVCADWPRERFVPAGTAKGHVIAPISRPFCSTCNRIRVTADGYLKPCLHSGEELSLRGLSGVELVEAVRAGILAKPKAHTLADAGSRSQRIMSEIGG